MRTLVHDSAYFYFSDGIDTWHISCLQGSLEIFFLENSGISKFLVLVSDFENFSGLKKFVFHVLTLYELWCTTQHTCCLISLQAIVGLRLEAVLSIKKLRFMIVLKNCNNTCLNKLIIIIILPLFGWH